jgi:hypothetical protein
MKLFTEEQMHSVILLALGRHGIYIPNKHYKDLIDLITPIEIPSDEEIDDRSYSDEQEKGFRNGAKWMRDKIQGGNK